jgi:hypothetical protein
MSRIRKESPDLISSVVIFPAPRRFNVPGFPFRLRLFFLGEGRLRSAPVAEDDDILEAVVPPCER